MFTLVLVIPCSLMERKNVMPDQDEKPTPIDEVEQLSDSSRILRMLLWVVPLIVIIVLIVTTLLAISAPVSDTVFPNIVSSL